MVVFDVTDKKSFDNVANWISSIDEHAPNNITRILAGNKIDKEDRVITKQQGEELAKSYKL